MRRVIIYPGQITCIRDPGKVVFSASYNFSPALFLGIDLAESFSLLLPSLGGKVLDCVPQTPVLVRPGVLRLDPWTLEWFPLVAVFFSVLSWAFTPAGQRRERVLMLHGDAMRELPGVRTLCKVRINLCKKHLFRGAFHQVAKSELPEQLDSVCFFKGFTVNTFFVLYLPLLFLPYSAQNL